MSNKRFLGYGKSRNHQSKLKPGEICLEEGNLVYAVNEEEFFCRECDGCGCKGCKFTGEESNCKNSKRGKKP